MISIFEQLNSMDQSKFTLFMSRSDLPTDQAVADFEKTIGFRLPEDYREFTMRAMGCLFVQAEESVWPRPKPEAIVPGWHCKYGLKVFGFSKEPPAAMHLVQRFNRFPQPTSEVLVPFMDYPMAMQVYCFTRSGQIVHWGHDYDQPIAINKGFSQLLVDELKLLVERAARVTTEPNPYA